MSANPNNPYGPARPDYKRIVLFGLLGLVVIVLLIMAFNFVFGDRSKDTFVTMLARQQFLSTTVDASQKRIRSGSFAKVNSDANLLLTTDTVNLTAQLKKKFGQDKLDDATKKREVDTTVTKKLDDATLLDKFDVTYRNILLQKINALLATAPTLRDHVSGQEFKAVMNKYIDDLNTISTQLTALNL